MGVCFIGCRDDHVRTLEVHLRVRHLLHESLVGAQPSRLCVCRESDHAPLDEGLEVLPPLRLLAGAGCERDHLGPRQQDLESLGDGVTDTRAFCKKLAKEYKVGLAPGEAFGPGGQGNIRLCFASGAERLSRGLGRIEAAIAAL